MPKKIKYKGHVIHVLDPKRTDQIAGLKKYIDQRIVAKSEAIEDSDINRKTLVAFTEAMKAINATRK